MIQIDYELTDQEIQETLGLLEGIPAAALDETCFEARVRMSVNGAELFGSANEVPAELEGANWKATDVPADGWTIVPILSMAGGLRNHVNDLPVDGRTRFLIPGGGEILLKRTQAEVSLDSSLSGQLAACQYEELKEALHRFASQVAEDLGQRAPTLKNHPLWHAWFS